MMRWSGFDKKNDAMQTDEEKMCNPEKAIVDLNPEAKTAGKEPHTRTAFTSVKILGSGCAKCNALEAAAKDALKQLGMDLSIEHVTDYSQIAAYGVMSTPALVVDGKVISYGKVLKSNEVIRLLQKIRE